MKKDKKEKKELSPQELQKRKKMLVYPLFVLIFAASMWFIFAPSGAQTEEQTEGFNADIPMPKERGIYNDKRDAYEQDAMKRKEDERMRSLQDIDAMVGFANEPEEEYQDYTAPTAAPAKRSSSGSYSSAYYYQDINSQLGSFYEPVNEEEPTPAPVESRIQELERKLEEKEHTRSGVEEQLSLLEKSYQMAAKYMPGAAANEAQQASTSAAETGKKAAVQPVSQVRHTVVSLLAAPTDDVEFIAAYSKPRNWGFNTPTGNEEATNKNSIRACINKTVTVTNGQEVQLRLLEPMRVGSYVIPMNTIVSGAAKIGGERLDITISYVQHADNIIPVEITVFDIDGNQGISVPGSEELNAFKEVAANMGSSVGTSISISDNAGSQLAADLGKGVIQGTSQYLNKKLRTVKVTLKASYKVLLVPPMK